MTDPDDSDRDGLVYGVTPCGKCGETEPAIMWELDEPITVTAIDLDDEGRAAFRFFGHDVPDEAESFDFTVEYLCGDCWADLDDDDD